MIDLFETALRAEIKPPQVSGRFNATAVHLVRWNGEASDVPVGAEIGGRIVRRIPVGDGVMDDRGLFMGLSDSLPPDEHGNSQMLIFTRESVDT